MPSHPFENLAEICELDTDQLQSMRTYPSEPFVQLLLLRLDEETSHKLADLHLGWQLSRVAGDRRGCRKLRSLMKRYLAMSFAGPEWSNRIEGGKALAMTSAWMELDKHVRFLVRGIFRRNDDEYMVLLGWVVQATMAARAQFGLHQDCACNYALARENLGPEI